MWLWLSFLWLALACMLGLWLGRVLRTAEDNEDVRLDVDRALERELAGL
ncbi:hypothetical protein [Klenkia sp. PcliD-1-E]|nr:hypothetical protein [Klenkia sp. PcliD-1-E]MCO7222411.1 hypothetical protein [Klenkia sp. PcliD-1-E]